MTHADPRAGQRRSSPTACAPAARARRPTCCSPSFRHGDGVWRPGSAGVPALRWTDPYAQRAAHVSLVIMTA